MTGHNILLAGFGGQGILFTGKVIAYAGLMEGMEVSWLPSYGPEMRGGTANCSVCLSDDPIGSPLVTEPDILVAMNLPSLEKFENDVVPGGIIIVDSSIITKKVSRSDVKVIYLPASEIAEKAGIKGAANMVILGKLFKEVAFCTPENLDKGLQKTIPAKKMDLLDKNRLCIRLGTENRLQTPGAIPRLYFLFFVGACARVSEEPAYGALDPLHRILEQRLHDAPAVAYDECRLEWFLGFGDEVTVESLRIQFVGCHYGGRREPADPHPEALGDHPLSGYRGPLVTISEKEQDLLAIPEDLAALLDVVHAFIVTLEELLPLLPGDLPAVLHVEVQLGALEDPDLAPALGMVHRPEQLAELLVRDELPVEKLCAFDVVDGIVGTVGHQPDGVPGAR